MKLPKVRLQPQVNHLVDGHHFAQPLSFIQMHLRVMPHGLYEYGALSGSTYM